MGRRDRGGPGGDPGIRQAASWRRRSSGDLELVAYVLSPTARTGEGKDRDRCSPGSWYMARRPVVLDRFRRRRAARSTGRPCPLQTVPLVGTVRGPADPARAADAGAAAGPGRGVSCVRRFFELAAPRSRPRARPADQLGDRSPVWAPIDRRVRRVPGGSHLLSPGARRDPQPIARSPSREPITEADVARFRAAVPCSAKSPDIDDRNPPAIFILSPPRSGTTLLRIMLAGHRNLFSASELQLLGFSTLRERAEAYTGTFSGWLDGTVRTLMEVEGLAADDAKAAVRAAEAEDLTTKAFYRRLQDAVRPRILVDKSPSYALDPGALRKAEADFDRPLYVHLVRHPAPMIDSFERHHMDQVLYLHEHPYGARQLAELVWTLSHRTITAFLDTVRRTAGSASGSRTWCEIRRPRWRRCAAPWASSSTWRGPPVRRCGHEDGRRRVPESAPMGDPGFLAHGRIDPTAAAPQDAREGSSALGEPTPQVARALGYDLGPDRAADRRPANALARQRALRAGRRASDGLTTWPPRADRDRRHGREVPRCRQRGRVLGQPARRGRVDPPVHRRGAQAGRRRPVGTGLRERGLSWTASTGSMPPSSMSRARRSSPTPSIASSSRPPDGYRARGLRPRGVPRPGRRVRRRGPQHVLPTTSSSTATAGPDRGLPAAVGDGARVRHHARRVQAGAQGAGAQREHRVLDVRGGRAPRHPEPARRRVRSRRRRRLPDPDPGDRRIRVPGRRDPVARRPLPRVRRRRAGHGHRQRGRGRHAQAPSTRNATRTRSTR